MPGPVSRPRPVLGRRSFLAAGGAAGVAALAAGAALPAGAQPGAALVPDGTRFLQTMTSAYPELADQPRLPQSYADESGLFSTAFVYDCALTVCALLAVGDRGTARVVGDGLLFAQQHDPQHDDGRLRQAYNVGPYVFYDGVPQPYGLVRPDRTANIGSQFGFLGTAVGDMAWPGIALLHLHRSTGDARYLDGARRIGEWILGRAVNPGALGGFRFGVDAADQPVPNVSTEHNIDCVALFRALGAADPAGRARWTDAGRRARALVETMWEPAGGYFYTGSDDGSTINRDPLPLDPQTWSWLALRDAAYATSLDWAVEALGTTDTPDSPNSQLPAGVSIRGVTFSDASLTSTAVYNGVPVDSDAVWLEGTAQVVTALRDRRAPRDAALAVGLVREIRRAQARLGAGQHAGGQLIRHRGMVSASSALDTGFGFGYFAYQHTGATAWAVMGERAVNPMQVDGLR
ncbi:AGE family epimerase/isomerase [Desertihabitans aurantiacus]|uniref:Tat pathway signal sequence domain protein n=1 Tax=Desertihabitans aurantiacus TaxID=2282477 RepID=UPI000DF7827F|nr:Tat pathway signal sequence domain protein [Desertihabitans aurantiacus]